MTTQKINSNEKYMLKGSLKKNGYDRWRLVTTASHISTGEERVFFIEFYTVNPALSPSECVLGYKSRNKVTEEDLHSALAGSLSAKNMKSETLVQPSFVMVRAGVLCENGKHIDAYFPSDQIQTGKTDLLFKVGTDESNYCSLTTSSTYGTVQISRADLIENPEYMCQDGKMIWNLRYEKQISFPVSKGSGLFWAPSGARTVFEGRIVLDGEEYEVTAQKSCGYFEKSWGKSLPSRQFHLNSSNLTSIINGKTLEKSCFVVDGEYNGGINVFVSLEGRTVLFYASKSKRYDVNYEFTENPDTEEGTKFHWSVSISDSKYVVDIDGYSMDTSMFIRGYECPEGKRRLLKTAGSGTGTGELRLYEKVKKNLVLIEHVHIADMIADYGSIEVPEE